jgi:hypothetical protein
MKSKMISSTKEKKNSISLKNRRLINGWKVFGSALIKFENKSEWEFLRILWKMAGLKMNLLKKGN